MHEIFVSMAVDIAMLKAAVGRSMKIGPVAQVDEEKGYRIRYGGSNSEPHLSPWYPHPETGKTSIPLEVGQIVGMINPSGDPRQGLIIRGGYSDKHKSPNADMAANVFDHADVRIVAAGGKLVITTGGTTTTFSSEGLDVNGGHIKNDGVAVDKTHLHTGVMPGGGLSGVPAGG